MKVYDQVKDLLTQYPELRDSDKKLLWIVWHKLGLLQRTEATNFITYPNYMKAPSSESITRARRKVQELHPELGASVAVAQERQEKAEQKGTFIFREED
jgi:uncharacterized pyridoxal phosphate-containing UPF0001 family protein